MEIEKGDVSNGGKLIRQSPRDTKKNSISQSFVSRSAASTSPESLLDMHSFGLHPRSIDDKLGTPGSALATCV